MVSDQWIKISHLPKFNSIFFLGAWRTMATTITPCMWSAALDSTSIWESEWWCATRTSSFVVSVNSTSSTKMEEETGTHFGVMDQRRSYFWSRGSKPSKTQNLQSVVIIQNSREKFTRIIIESQEITCRCHIENMNHGDKIEYFVMKLDIAAQGSSVKLEATSSTFLNSSLQAFSGALINLINVSGN